MAKLLSPITPHVSEVFGSYLPEVPGRHARLFRNGANQAVRIPKEFELPDSEVIIRQEGKRLVIEPVQTRPAKGTAAAMLLALEEIRKLGPCADEFPDVDEGLLPLDDIVL